jgi:hypothetical protein
MEKKIYIVLIGIVGPSGCHGPLRPALRSFPNDDKVALGTSSSIPLIVHETISKQNGRTE